MLRKGMLVVALVLILVLAVVVPASAASTGNKGQPNQNCEALTASPNGFNSSGFTNHATQVYAGTGANTTTSANSHAVSQYDVACFQQPTRR